MAALSVISSAAGGAVFSTASAAGGGDTFVNNGKTLFYVNNGGGSSINVTFTAQNTINVDGQGLTVSNLVVAVTNGTAKIFGPFPAQIFNNSSGAVAVTYSAVTSVTVAVISLP